MGHLEFEGWGKFDVFGLELSDLDWAAVLSSVLSAISSLSVIAYMSSRSATERAKPRNVLVTHTFVTDLMAAACDLSKPASLDGSAPVR